MKFIIALMASVISFSSFSQEKDPKITLTPKVHFRTFWMSTTYPSDFKNDFALGTSLNLGTELQFQERIKIHFGYRFFGNVWSSDLTEVDALSGQSNRYEAGLFDLLDPSDRFFGKLENLSISYSRTDWGVKLGRMGIDSDWINLQDGRLSPTAVEGVNFWLNNSKKFRIEFWGISKISVRGSSKWMSIGESVGVFPVGRDLGGNPSKYFQNTSSDWISVLELSKKWDSYLIKSSVTTVANISNTITLTGEHTFPKQANSWMFGMQLGFQQGLGDGGNKDLNLAYKDPTDRNYAVSFRLGYSKDRFKSNLNLTQMGGKGRWLSPREWGKDAWYTFIPRERNEGFSNLTAVTALISYDFPKAGLSPYINFGFHFLPDLNSAKANKYNMPSYRQINIGLKYHPIRSKRLSIHALVMNKEALNRNELTPNQRYNKVGMIHTNLIVNWNF